MADIEELFKQHGFVLANKKDRQYEMVINGDYHLYVEPEYGDWVEDFALLFIFVCKRFGQFSKRVFKYTSASDYDESAYVGSNGAGHIGTGTGLLEREEEPYFTMQNNPTTVVNLLTQINSIKNAKDLYHFLYVGSGKRLLAIFDGVWVQLFLLFEMGMSHEKIIETFKNNPSDVLKASKKDFDLKGLAEFAIQYEQIKDLK